MGWWMASIAQFVLLGWLILDSYQLDRRLTRLETMMKGRIVS